MYEEFRYKKQPAYRCTKLQLHLNDCKNISAHRIPAVCNCNLKNYKNISVHRIDS